VAAALDRILTQQAPDSPELSFEHAVLRLALNDVARYRSICGNMLETFRTNGKRSWLEFTAHAYALAPDGPAEGARAVELAERRMAVISGNPWCGHVLAMALYRAGRFADADVQVRNHLVSNPAWEYGVVDWLILAMANQRLGRPDEARRWLKRADGWVATRLHDRPGRAHQAIPENWQLRDGILLHLLLREARDLIKTVPPALPVEPFAPPEPIRER
jgi:hypothetical protein